MSGPKEKESEMAVKQKRISTLPNTRVYGELKRHWGDVPVVDAQEDLRVFIQPADVTSATAKDPGHCVFAQACKRQFAATKVLFWRSVAYVELPSRDGKRRVERFIMSSEMRKLIQNFDRGRTVPNVAGFVLKKPKPSSTFAGKLAINRASRNRQRQALSKGLKVPQRGRRTKKSIALAMDVRDGKGQVHFNKA
jgi:hypothetical protein